MVVVSHLFLFLRINFRGRRDSCESRLPLFRTIYFPTAPIKYSDSVTSAEDQSVRLFVSVIILKRIFVILVIVILIVSAP